MIETAEIDRAIERMDAALATRATPKAAPAALADSVQLTCASDLRIEPVRWLWPGWLARGKFHLLAGAPGVGKTTVTMSMAATVTTGTHWPDASRCDAGRVLIYSGEDDPSDTLAPRLLAAGADLSRVHFVMGTMIAGESQPFDPARDLAALTQAADEIGGIDLLIVDPVVGAVTGDSHKNSEVRRALQPLAELAARIDCAVLGISHFSKGGQGSDPAQRVIGSVAFTALARIVLVAAKAQNKEGEPTRILARAKSNIGPDAGGFEYSLEQEEISTDVHASRVVWGLAVEGTARELLTDPDDNPQASETDAAADMLREELHAIVWKDATEASAPLVAAGFTKKQIWKASRAIGVQRRKSGGAGTAWQWRLPGEVVETENGKDSTKDSNFGNGESLESYRESLKFPDAVESSQDPEMEVL